MFKLFNNSTKDIYANELDGIIGSTELIDIREPYEFKTGNISIAKNIPMGILLSSPDKYLDKSKKYYIICQSGGRSKHASGVLAKSGYDVINVAGGMSLYSRTRS